MISDVVNQCLADTEQGQAARVYLFLAAGLLLIATILTKQSVRVVSEGETVVIERFGI